MDKPIQHYDKRIIQRSVKKGILREEEVSEWTASLPDRSDNVMPPEPEAPAEGTAVASAEPSEPSSVDSAA